MNRLNVGLTALVSCGFAVFYALAQSWGYVLAISSDLLFVLVSGVCSFFAALVVRKWRTGSSLGLVHLGLFMAVFLWFLGELVWSIYAIILRVEVPYPSLADLFYLAGYVPAFVGMFQFLWVFREILTWTKTLVAGLSGLFVLCATYIFLINPLTSSSTDLLTKIFAVTYPSLDAILLVMAIMILIVFSGGEIAKPWLWIFFGLLFTATADIMFSLGTLEDWYYPGHPIELLYLWGYASLTLGFEGQRKQIKPAEEVTPVPLLGYRLGAWALAYYAETSQKMKLFLSFIAEGLAMGDRVLYVYPDEEATMVREMLELNGIDVPARIDEGSLVLKPHSQVYPITNGRLDKEATIKFWIEIVSETHRRGYRHWRELIDRGDLSFYRSQMNDFLDLLNDPVWQQYYETYRPIDFLIELDAIKRTPRNTDFVEAFIRGFPRSWSATTILIELVDYADSFSKQIDASHTLIEDKLLLMEFDPNSGYDDLVRSFLEESIANAKPAVVFTQIRSRVYTIARQNASPSLFCLSTQPHSPTHDADRNVRTLPLSDTSLILDSINKLVQNSQGRRISLVFDGLSDMIVTLGLEKTYKFVFSLLELLTASKVTGLFLLNSTAHDDRQVSAIRSLFTANLIYGRSGLHLVKAPWLIQIPQSLPRNR